MNLIIRTRCWYRRRDWLGGVGHHVGQIFSRYSVSIRSHGLSPLFVDKCFGLFSIVGSDSADGLLRSASVLNKCSSMVRAQHDRFSSLKLPKPRPIRFRFYSSRRNIKIVKAKQCKRYRIKKSSFKLNIHRKRCKALLQDKKKNNKRIKTSINRSRASSLFRNRSTSSFLIFTLTRSLLPSTDMYSVFRRNLLLISFNSVTLHLAFDYTDRTFTENVLSTDISFLNLFRE